MIDIKNEMEKMDVSTARGRAILQNKAINLSDEREATYATETRGKAYLEFSKRLREMCEENHYGIKEEELEAVEFIRERLIACARMAYDELIKEYK